MREARKNLSRDKIYINGGEWTGGEWTDYICMRVKRMTEWRITKLDLDWNYRATVVKEIVHVHFTALTSLDLTRNQIESVEALPSAQMPLLTGLCLSVNKITSVKIIRKASWPALQMLRISSNYLKDGQQLTEGYFPQMTSLTLNSSFSFFSSFSSSLCFPAKMQASLRKIGIGRYKFHFKRSIEKVLKRRRWFRLF